MTDETLADGDSRPARSEHAMHVAHVIHSLDVGGAEADLISKAAVLVRRGGFRCSVLTFSHAGAMADAAADAGIEVHDMGGGNAIRAARRIRRWLLRERPSVLHAHLLNGAVLAGACSRLTPPMPLVWTAQYIYPGSGAKIRLLRWPFLALPTRIVASSKAVASRLQDLGVEPGKIRVIHNCVDTRSWSLPPDPQARRRVREELDVPGRARVVGAVGRLIADKSLDTLVRAMPHVLEAESEAYLVLVGEGPERASLEALAGQLGIADRVVMTGQRRDIADLLDAMDVFVLPSVNEALGIAAIEASARGKPVVASRAGGLPEVVSDLETGLLFSPSDSLDCARALTSLLDRPAWALQLGAAGRERARRQFDCAALAEAQYSVYVETLASG